MSKKTFSALSPPSPSPLIFSPLSSLLSSVSSTLFSLPLQTLMLVSSTTRPLLGCVWNFPSSYNGLAYATTSMVIHEILPIILMAITNLGSLYTLYTHGRTHNPAHMTQDAPVIKRIPAERRAAKVRETGMIQNDGLLCVACRLVIVDGKKYNT